MTQMGGFASWDPFTDPNDARHGQTTQYLGDASTQKAPASQVDWDPFEDHDMLQLMGDIAMESDDVEAIEAWIQQAEASRLNAKILTPKRDRVHDLKLRAKDHEKRKSVTQRFDEAMRGNDRDLMREVIREATRIGAHPNKLEAASRRIEVLKREAATQARQKDLSDSAERERRDLVLAEAALQKLEKQQLLPWSAELELRDDERLALDRIFNQEQPTIPTTTITNNEIEIKPMHEPIQNLTFSIKFCFPSGETEAIQVSNADKGAVLLAKLISFKGKHYIPEKLGLFRPSGAEVDFDNSLQAQGIHHGCTIRVDNAILGSRDPASARKRWQVAPPSDTENVPASASAVVSVNETEQERFERECERWIQIYWAICLQKPSFGVIRDLLRKHELVVVLGWLATDDPEIMQQTTEAMQKLRASFVILAGESEPTEECTAQHSVQLAYLMLPNHAESIELGQAVSECVKLHCGDEDFVIVVVSRCFAVKRVCFAIDRFRLPPEPGNAWPVVNIIPYCQDPEYALAEDVKHRRQDVLMEADLMAEIEPTTFNLEEECQLQDLMREENVEPRVRLELVNPFMDEWVDDHNEVDTMAIREETPEQPSALDDIDESPPRLRIGRGAARNQERAQTGKGDSGEKALVDAQKEKGGKGRKGKSKKGKGKGDGDSQSGGKSDVKGAPNEHTSQSELSVPPWKQSAEQMPDGYWAWAQRRKQERDASKPLPKRR